MRKVIKNTLCSRADLINILLLAIILFIFFSPNIFGHYFFWDDFLSYHVPNKFFYFTNLKDGVLPLWNPYSGAGQPFLADIQTQSLYPLNLLIIPFFNGAVSRTAWLIELWTIFHVFLGGTFLYALTKYFHRSRPASLFSAITYALSLPIVAHCVHINIISTIIWLPLIFLFFHKSLKEKPFKNIILSAVFLAIAFLAGHPQIFFLTIFLLGAYSVFNSLSFLCSAPINVDRIKASIFLYRNPIAIIFLTAGLIAIQLLPFLELVSLSTRSYSSYQFATSYSLEPLQFILSSISPRVFGGYGPLNDYLLPGNFWETASYCGLLGLIFCAIGAFFHKNNKIVIFFTIILLLTLGLSFGGNFIIYPTFYLFLPILKIFRCPGRFLLLYLFSFSILTAFGYDFIMSYDFKNNQELVGYLKKIFHAILLSSIIFVSTIFLLISTISLLSPVGTTTIDNFVKFNIKGIGIFLLLLYAIFLVFQRRLWGNLLNGSFKKYLFLILLLDLFLAGFNFNMGVWSPKKIYDSSPAIDFLKKENASSFRVLTNNVIPSNGGAVHGFSTIETWTATPLSSYKEYTSGQFNSSRPTFSMKPLNSNLLNVKFVFCRENNCLSPELVRVEGFPNLYANPKGLPRTFFVPGKKLIEIKESDLMLIDPNLPSITSYSPNKIEIHLSTKMPGNLFLSEINYPGWQAIVNGNGKKIYYVNKLFRGIYFENGGDYDIIMRFKPKSLLIGSYITFSFVLGLAIIIIGKALLTAGKKYYRLNPHNLS
ncbi:YfhO family protein [Patescibacteria group bacterium]|nr:YfhO family protein [Patescibacteria group bacterium]MBU4512395.1 YfhO family protein [Patescibacteria group bacterium]MCG2692969.1 YfhO family protein [Candidatus Parcubacteria bacterium]